MKLKNELDYTVNQFKKIKNLESYAEKLKETGNYKDFGTRLAWDCIHATIPSEIVCGWYDKYNCNDDHITTMAKAALRELKINF